MTQFRIQVLCKPMHSPQVDIAMTNEREATMESRSQKIRQCTQGKKKEAIFLAAG